MVEVPWQRPLRVLTYGDSNTWGFVTDAATGNPSRLPDAERWPGILQAALGTNDLAIMPQVLLVSPPAGRISCTWTPMTTMILSGTSQLLRQIDPFMRQ